MNWKKLIFSKTILVSMFIIICMLLMVRYRTFGNETFISVFKIASRENVTRKENTARRENNARKENVSRRENIARKENVSRRENVTSSPNKCPSVLNNMIFGKWRTYPMTDIQKEEMRTFLEISRSQHAIPKSLQRKDSVCGKGSFPPHLGPRITWFLALCDPYGKTPCCFNYKCAAKSVDECKCKNCLDMRQPLHAEYADWIPLKKNCQLKKYDYEEACKLLDGITLFFSGDSYIRHIYTALLLFLRNNVYDGAMQKGVSKEIHDKCTGMYMFTEVICRLHLDTDAKDVCGGKMKIIYRYYFSSAFAPSFIQQIKALTNVSRSLAVFGIGLHDGFNQASVLNRYVKPAVLAARQTSWPRLLWTTPHSPGMLKNAITGPQSKKGVLNYIAALGRQLSKLNVPVLNTFNMTEGVMSFDGNHYGLGVNMWKIQLIFNYIQELKDSGQL